MEAPETAINATAERKTFLLLMARALSTTSYTRPLSLPYPILGGGGERGGGGGVLLDIFLGGEVLPAPHTLTLFNTKIADFPTLFKTNFDF